MAQSQRSLEATKWGMEAAGFSAPHHLLHILGHHDQSGHVGLPSQDQGPFATVLMAIVNRRVWAGRLCVASHAVAEHAPNLIRLPTSTSNAP